MGGVSLPLIDSREGVHPARPLPMSRVIPLDVKVEGRVGGSEAAACERVRVPTPADFVRHMGSLADIPCSGAFCPHGGGGRNAKARHASRVNVGNGRTASRARVSAGRPLPRFVHSTQVRADGFDVMRPLSP